MIIPYITLTRFCCRSGAPLSAQYNPSGKGPEQQPMICSASTRPMFCISSSRVQLRHHRPTRLSKCNDVFSKFLVERRASRNLSTCTHHDSVQPMPCEPRPVNPSQKKMLSLGKKTCGVCKYNNIWNVPARHASSHAERQPKTKPPARTIKPITINSSLG